MSEKKMNGQFKVFVDDNYHYMDESERYAVGSYDSLEEAVDKCRELTIKSLNDLYEKGITPDNLKSQWCLFGEDPFIVGGRDGGRGAVPFSARKFVSTELCKEIIDSIDHIIAKPEA
jgi:hypothetical protein